MYKTLKSYTQTPGLFNTMAKMYKDAMKNCPLVDSYLETFSPYRVNL